MTRIVAAAIVLTIAVAATPLIAFYVSSPPTKSAAAVSPECLRRELRTEYHPEYWLFGGATLALVYQTKRLCVEWAAERMIE